MLANESSSNILLGFLLNEKINILIVQIIFSPLPTTEAKSILSEEQWVLWLFFWNAQNIRLK